MTELNYCILTGKKLGVQSNIIIDGTTYKYFQPIVGNVKVTDAVLMMHENIDGLALSILSGICRNAFEFGEEPPLITTTFIKEIENNTKYPVKFSEKCLHFLKYLYKKGDEDYTTLKIFDSDSYYPVCFSTNEDEFIEIMEHLIDNNLIKSSPIKISGSGTLAYKDTKLTPDGMELVKKDLPKIPMIGLVEQKITTGNPSIDEKINHAKQLFFQEPQTEEAMRSACFNLMIVLEPIRNEIKQYFSHDDIELFFTMVNNFDVRHNHDRIKLFMYPEQFEWLFYSLLNTINTYSKLKNKALN